MIKMQNPTGVINNEFRVNGLESAVTWYFSLPRARRSQVDRIMKTFNRLGIIDVVALQEIYVLVMSASR